MDELDRLRQDLRTVERIARETRAGRRDRDEALADVERIAGAHHARRPAPDPVAEVLSERAIAEDLRA